MITKEFAEATTEINKILSYLPTEYIEKIPIKLRKFLKDVESKEYIPNIDPYKQLDEQDIKPKTKTLLTIIYRNYWCNEQERAELDKKLIENDKKYEQELREKYNPDDIFKKKRKTSTNVQENNLLMEIKKESLWKRLINYIKNILIRKKV